MEKLTLKNLSFSYGTNATLQEIDCEFTAGRFYAVIGPNGSGKTTLLDLISGFLKPHSGELFIDRKNTARLPKDQLARKIALVSQDYAINFPFPVRDVIMMGRHPYIPRFAQPSEQDWALVDKVMEKCGISDLKDRKINELSGGEKQRCVFARALCQDTPILLLDEAFSSMDIKHTLKLLGVVRQLVKEKNRLVISVFHDLNMASSWSDGVLMLKQGRMKGFGITLDLFNKKLIEDVFNINAKIEFNPYVGSNQIYYPVQ